MKYLILCSLLLIGSIASAQVPTGAKVYPMRVQLSEGAECAGVAVSSGSVGHQLILATSGYSYISVESEDATANLFCAPRADVALSGALRGKKVRPAQSILFFLAPLVNTFYCLSDGATPTNAMICRGK